MHALLGALSVPSIKVNADWGFATGAATVVSAARTLNVPVGSDGEVRLDLTSGVGDYRKNSDAYAAVVDEAVVAVATGDTLQFRVTAAASGMTVAVYDNTTGALVGTSQITTS